MKGKDPDTFDGSNRDLYPAFVLQLALLLAVTHADDDVSKIRAAGSYLRGIDSTPINRRCNLGYL